MAQDVVNIARPLVAELEAAWNAADGRAFSTPFTEDADFVAIRGDYHRTREAIAHGHQAIFDTIYKGSTVRYELVDARMLTDDVVVAHARSSLQAPTGPLMGHHNSMMTLVLAREGETWRIAAFHNTLVATDGS